VRQVGDLGQGDRFGRFVRPEAADRLWRASVKAHHMCHLVNHRNAIVNAII
jgi:hypothetical protein